MCSLELNDMNELLDMLLYTQKNPNKPQSSDTFWMLTTWGMIWGPGSGEYKPLASQGR